MATRTSTTKKASNGTKPRSQVAGALADMDANPRKHVETKASLTIQTMMITLIGDAPLKVHAWSHKAKEMMLAKQMKQATGAKEAKDPVRDYWDSLYILVDDPKHNRSTPVPSAKMVFGFPTIGFKSAAVDACSHVEGITKVEARGAFHINGEMVVIDGTPEMAEDMVRVGMGTADIRYRGVFKTWRTTFEIRYNKNVLSEEQIVDLFNTAGFAIGVGEHRPEKNGSLGMFHVATLAELEG